MSGVVIFAGPSLPDRDTARATLPGDYRGPAARGDVLRAALGRPAAIVLIDGWFERVPAPHHKEILWALAEGIPVYGAASLGALRAAELAAFGMTGVGPIHAAFASGDRARDDEVALVHGPEEAGYAALSEPLCNIRATLAAAEAQGVIDAAQHAALIEEAEAAFYPERGYAPLLASLAARAAGASARLRSWLETGRVDRKARDAMLCLARVASDLATGMAPDPPDFAFAHTDAFDALMAETAPELCAGAARADAGAAEIDALALRLDTLAHGPVPPERLAAEVAAFRAAHDLPDPQALAAWLADRGLDIDTLSQALEAQARIARARRKIADEIPGRMALRASLRAGR